MPNAVFIVLLPIVAIIGWMLGTIAYEFNWVNKIRQHLHWRRKSPYKVGDKIYDHWGVAWIIYSIARNQYVLQLEGSTIYHAEVRSSIERYYSVWPPTGV